MSAVPTLRRPSAPDEPPAAQQEQPRPHRWTVDEYYAISDMGLLPQRTELLDGEILDMLAQDNPHMISVSKTARLLLATFDEAHYWVQIQGTSSLDQHNAPEPDFAVLERPPTDRGMLLERPILAIEISDTTLLFDQTVKASLYASRQIREYWIINLRARQVEVYRSPVEDASRRYGWRYASMTAIQPPGYVVPLCKPDAKLEVARMLP